MGKALVLGAGPLGRAVGKKLMEAGDTVVFATRTGLAKSNPLEKSPTPLNYMQLDLLGDYQQSVNALAVDIIYFCAAPKYWLWSEELVPMVKAALDIGDRLQAPVIYGDNLYAYGKPTAPLNEVSPIMPVTQKGKARKEALDLVLAANQTGKPNTAVVQASDFYGPGVDISIIGRDVFANTLEGKTVYCLGNIDALHSFTFIGDFADAMINVAGDRDCYGQTWIAPCSEPTAVREVIRLIAKIRQKEVSIRVAPKWMFYLMGFNNKAIKELREMYYLYDSDFVVDSLKYQNKFGLKAVSLEKGIGITAAGY